MLVAALQCLKAASCTAEIAAALASGKVGVPFDIEATVTFPCSPECSAYAVRDGTGGEMVLRDRMFWPRCPLRAGDKIRAKGVTDLVSQSRILLPVSTNVEVLASGAAPEAMPVDIADVSDGKCDWRLVKVEGFVGDAFMDEIDGRWAYLVLRCGRDTLYACFTFADCDASALRGLVGAGVSVAGVCTPDNPGSRRMIGRLLMTSWPTGVSVRTPAPPDPFDVPPLGESLSADAPGIKGMGRQKSAGRVVAVWRRRHFLLRTENGGIVRVDLSEPSPPAYGDNVEAAGMPETDLYRLNLSSAVWRPAKKAFRQEPEAIPATADDLMRDSAGRNAVQTRKHGVALRLRGVVRDVPHDGARDDRLILECGGKIVQIDASECPEAFAEIGDGCEIEVSGTCLVETENWRPNAPFPHIEGVALVVRTPRDVRLLSNPPWWTPGRLAAVMASLVAALAGVFAWNRSLKRIAERRGRELSAETVARTMSEMKVEERTRLAIELHDALSQNLTGAALEIETTNTLMDSDLLHAHEHLDMASKTVRSCREELRNCLWDLRNDALGEKTMNAAIRTTLSPHIADVDLSVRFGVPREKLSDDIAHALLRIIRELVQNAVRHGGAKSVKVAGCIDGERLLFSVADDGCGFDPEKCPGIPQGHFGLQGIRERVNRFGGEMKIESSPGMGTKATIAFKLDTIHQ